MILMNKMAIKKIGLLFLIFQLLGIDCVLENNLRNENMYFEIVKIDERNERLFVVIELKIIKNFKLTEEVIEQAWVFINKNKPSWSNRWNVSFFSDKKYASYKDDIKVSKGSWRENYLAEYKNENNLLILFPLRPNKRVEFKTKLNTTLKDKGSKP
jgi:hypothetical protein